jgi:hypothetical protein
VDGCVGGCACVLVGYLGVGIQVPRGRGGIARGGGLSARSMRPPGIEGVDDYLLGALDFRPTERTALALGVLGIAKYKKNKTTVH